MAEQLTCNRCREPTLPAKYIPELRKAAADAGVDWDKFQVRPCTCTPRSLRTLQHGSACRCGCKCPVEHGAFDYWVTGCISAHCLDRNIGLSHPAADGQQLPCQAADQDAAADPE